MRIPRFFIPDDISNNQKMRLPEEAGSHIARVLRMKCDQKVILFNGQGGEYLAVIIEVQRNRVTVKIESYNDKDIESSLKITLVQCISRGERMDYTIQKSVELGVDKIQPVFSQRGMVKLDQKRAQRKIEHWQKVAISACEQSGRNSIPEVCTPLSITESLQQSSHDSLKLVMHTNDTAEPFKLSQVDAPLNQCILLAGPEGGLTDEEVKLAQQKDFKIIQLGPRVLRTETAALALISILQAQLGDMQ